MSQKPIVVNLVAGTLGVGKTTAINHLLEQRPPEERWAVLVNEYGRIGLDAALIEGGGPKDAVHVREVAGGCICCSAGFMFEVSLVLLLQRRPDRLLIEPTGLATVSGILETLNRPGVREAVDVRTVISLVDPTKWDAESASVEALDQVEAADMLVANRSDLADEAQLATFDTWAQGLFPRKAAVERIEHGRIPLAWLDLVQDRFHTTGHPVARPEVGQAHRAHTGPKHDHDHDHGHDHAHEAPPEVEPSAERPVIRLDHTSSIASTIGWAIWSEQVFDAERLRGWIEEVAERTGMQRLKAVIRTSEGWRSFNLADGARCDAKAALRRDSRLEVIFTGDSRPDAGELQEGLLSCLDTTRDSPPHCPS